MIKQLCQYFQVYASSQVPLYGSRKPRDGMVISVHYGEHDLNLRPSEQRGPTTPAAKSSRSEGVNVQVSSEATEQVILSHRASKSLHASLILAVTPSTCNAVSLNASDPPSRHTLSSLNMLK